MTDIGINRLKVVLAEKRVKNKWLADKLKKNPSTISQWCTNERQPSLETLMEIAAILEVDVRSLINSTSENA